MLERNSIFEQHAARFHQEKVSPRMVEFYQDQQFLVTRYLDTYLVLAKKVVRGEMSLAIPGQVPLELLAKLFPDKELVIVADCLTDASITEATYNRPGHPQLTTAESHPVGYALRHRHLTVLNIDHHAETKIMMKAISSGNLAFNYIKGVRSLPPGTPVIITHTDADSTISTAILHKLLPFSATQECCDAVIAADHTGQETDLGDLLQVTEGLHDIAFSQTLLMDYFVAKRQTGRAFNIYKFLNQNYPPRRVVVQFQGQTVTVTEALLKYRAQRDQVRRLFSQPEKIPSSVDERVIRVKNGYALWDLGSGVLAVTDTVIPQPGQPLRPLLPTEYLSLVVPPDLAQKTRVVIFSRPKPLLDAQQLVIGCKTNSAGNVIFDIKTTVMPDYFEDTNLKQLGLEELGWGGRYNMGSNSRITDDENCVYDAVVFGEIIANRLPRQKY